MSRRHQNRRRRQDASRTHRETNPLPLHGASATPRAQNDAPSSPRRTGDWTAAAPGRSTRRHALIVAVAGLSTMCIVGSGVYLIWQRVEEARMKQQIQQVVEGLRHRTPAELDRTIERLRAQPELARRVMPSIVRCARRPNAPPELRSAAVHVAGAFVSDDARIATALHKLRLQKEEYLAAEAVEALGDARPRSRAAELLAGCLEDPIAPAVVDVVCEQLITLGADGREALSRHSDRLSSDRLTWMSGLVAERPPQDRDAWLLYLYGLKEQRPPGHAADEYEKAPST